MRHLFVAPVANGTSCLPSRVGLGRDRARPSVSTAAGNSRPPVHGMPSLSVSTTIRSMETAEESNANGRAVSMKPPIAAASSMPPYHLVNFCAYPKIDIRRLAKTRMPPSRHTNTPLRGTRIFAFPVTNTVLAPARIRSCAVARQRPKPRVSATFPPAAKPSSKTSLMFTPNITDLCPKHH